MPTSSLGVILTSTSNWSLAAITVLMVAQDEVFTKYLDLDGVTLAIVSQTVAAALPDLHICPLETPSRKEACLPMVTAVEIALRRNCSIMTPTRSPAWI